MKLWQQRAQDLQNPSLPNWLWEAGVVELLSDLGEDIPGNCMSRPDSCWHQELSAALHALGIQVDSTTIDEILDSAWTGVQYLGEVIRQRGLVKR